MIRYIWTQWWRHPERFLLLLVGMLAVSSVLSYFIGVTESSSGTTHDILQKRWKATYHLVVRPPDTRSVTERDGLLEPNYLSGLHGGISLANARYRSCRTAGPYRIRQARFFVWEDQQAQTTGNLSACCGGICQRWCTTQSNDATDKVLHRRPLEHADRLGTGAA